LALLLHYMRMRLVDKQASLKGNEAPNILWQRAKATPHSRWACANLTHVVCASPGTSSGQKSDRISTKQHFQPSIQRRSPVLFCITIFLSFNPH